MVQGSETCSGLLWLPSGPAPWICCANAHVYNVQLTRLPLSPAERPTLRWLTFLVDDDSRRYVHLQVPEDCAELDVADLTINGEICAVRPYLPKAGRS